MTRENRAKSGKEEGTGRKVGAHPRSAGSGSETAIFPSDRILPWKSSSSPFRQPHLPIDFLPTLHCARGILKSQNVPLAIREPGIHRWKRSSGLRTAQRGGG